jgi:hypothetical protein
MRQVYPFLFLAVLLTFACGGDDAPEATPSPTGSITRDKLQLMPLSADELGLDFEDLEVSDESGYLTSDQLAGDTTDPRDSAADIEGSGWVASYKFGYEDPTLSLDPGAQDGGTTLDLFEDEASATAFLRKQLLDPEHLRGEIFLGGFEVQDTGVFGVTGGDEGFGLKIKYRYGQMSINGWIAGFRLGALIAAVQMSRTDDSDVALEMQDLVVKLEERVRDVSAGEAQGTPLPLPSTDPDAPGQAVRPSQAPFLDEMALTLNDLPDGSTLDKEGYSPQDNRIEYERDFDLGPGVANSGPFGLQVELELFPSKEIATTQFNLYRDRVLGPSAQTTLQDVYTSQPFEVSNVTVTALSIAPAGDDYFAASITYDMVIGNVENTFVYIRVGQVTGLLGFSGFSGQTTSDYIGEMLGTLVERIEAELASS